MKNDDEEWFDALNGKNAKGRLTSDHIEGSAVRRNLMLRRKLLESEAEKFNPVEFEKLRKKLITNGHLVTKDKNKFNLRQSVYLFISFIAGSISSVMIIFGLTSGFILQMDGLRSVQSEGAPSRINSSGDIESITQITLSVDDPISTAHALESKAWDIGLHTQAQGTKDQMMLTIKDLPTNNLEASELKLLLGLHPRTQGDITVKIIK